MAGWALVYVGPPVEADIVAAALESAGMEVQVIMESSSTIGFGPGGAETQVYVTEEQAGAARDVIRRAERR